MAIMLTFPLTIAAAGQARAVPDKTVVLTFDDAVKSHITFVAPMLKELGFGATFFVTHAWMNDTENFMSWEDIAELHTMGFEVGNHTWTHPGFAQPKVAGRMKGELALVENELARVGVPKPVSFAWTGNGFGPEAVETLDALGYKFARRGMQPEVPYGELVPGPLYDPAAHHPLLIPSSGDAYADWTLDNFKAVVDRARDGKIAVVQFHGVPDVAHPWVHTPPEQFQLYMDYLKQNDFHVIALRDVAEYLPVTKITDDPMLTTRHPNLPDDEIVLPVEMAATREDLPYWLANMMGAHGYSLEEAAQVCGYAPAELGEKMATWRLGLPDLPNGALRVLPYPGGRHPRIGFLEGAIDPQRGTKASFFLPWDPKSYVVLDLPEAIFSNLGLTYLAHTHVPTIWDEQNVIIDNVDWERHDGTSLTFTRTLPNNIKFGSSIVPHAGYADLELWLDNGTDAALTGQRTQICLMLKGAAGFNGLTNDNKRFDAPVSAVSDERGEHWVLVAFDRCGRTWGNTKCPCLHADPVLPDAAPGERVAVKGKLWFCDAADLDDEIAKAKQDFTVIEKN